MNRDEKTSTADPSADPAKPADAPSGGEPIRDPGADESGAVAAAESGRDDVAAGRPSEDTAPVTAPADIAPAPGRGSGLAIAVAVLALIAAGAALFLWWRAEMAPPATGDAATADLSDRLARVEERLSVLEDASEAASAGIAQRIGTLADRIESLEARAEAGGGADAAALQDLDRRVGEIESRLAGRVDRLSDRLEETAAQEARLDALADRFDGVATRVDALGEAESRLADLAGRVASLEVEITEARRRGTAASALLLAVGQLRAAVDAGEAYAGTLATVTALGAEPRALAALRSHAETGVATRSALRERFALIAGEILRAAAAPEGAAWYERALAEITGAVTVRRTGEDVTGDDPAAVVARAEARLARNDLAGAVEAVESLDGTAAAAAAGWLADARARLAVERALAGLTDLALERVASESPPEPSPQPARAGGGSE